MLEKMSTSPPYALTSSTSLTNCFLLCTLGDLFSPIARVSSCFGEEKGEGKDGPEDLIRYQQLADRPSFGRLHDVRLTVPSSEGVLFEHFEESVSSSFGVSGSTWREKGRGELGTHLSSMMPS